MKNLNKIKAKILSNKELVKILNSEFYGENLDEKIDLFISQSQRYIKASEQSRLFSTIYSVSNSGMSRNINIFEHVYDTKQKRGFILNFNMLFIALGYKRAKNDGFKVNGSGMDMIFHSHYCNINDLFRLGFINKNKVDSLRNVRISNI